MNKILTVLVLAITVQVNAANYYFSSLSGNDSRTAVQARNPSTPWQSIDKLNQLFSQLQPGDSVLFKRGETFYGAIIITKSGTPLHPIVFSGYGNGNKPVITGFTTITSWAPTSAGIFESTCTSCNSSLNMVMVNDTLQPIGRFPKLTAANGGYWTINSHGQNTVQSVDLAGRPNYSGGEIVMRKYQWIMDRAVINSQSGTSISYTPQMAPRHPDYNYEPFDGHGFFIQNHPATLTTPGDWSYEKTTKKIKMYQPGNSKVKVTTLETLVNAQHKKYLTFVNLAFKGSNLKTFNLVSCNNIIISHCDMDFAGTDAINFDTDSLFRNIIPDSSLRLPDNDPSYEDEFRDVYAAPRYVNTDTSYAMTIEYCTINNTNNNAFFASNTYKSIIQNNLITNTGLNRGMGLSGDQQYFAMLYVGSKSIVRNNVIRRTGYIGIHFEGDSTIIRNNLVDSFCMVKGDGGGIYTQGELKKRGRRITSNIVINGIGDRFGLTTEIRNNPFAGNVHGIYIDNNAQYVEIDSNTVARIEGTALELNGANFITARNNTFYDGTRAQVDYQQLKRGFAGLSIKQNIFFAKKADQLIGLYHGNFNNQVNTWGVIDSNYYCRPVLEPDGVDTSGYSRSPFLIDYSDGGIIEGTNGRFYSLDKWKEISGQDAHTLKTPPGIDASGTRFEYNPTDQAKTITLTGQYIDVKNQPYQNSVTLAPFSSIILLRKVTPIVTQTITFGALAAKTLGDPDFIVSATATSGLPVSFRIISGPATISGTTISLNGTGIVIVEATQTGNSNYTAAPAVRQNFEVAPATSTTPVGCSATGSITREQWTNILGTVVIDIPLNTPPQSSAPIFKLETENTGDWMGARVRGYICPPLTGNYTFTIAGDDGAELWLSSSNDPTAKVKIAGYVGWTGFQEFNKFPGQVSAPINLQAGQPYYIEVLHKNGAGGDHFSVKWTMPNGVTETPIPGSRLSPYTGATANRNGIVFDNTINELVELPDVLTLDVRPNPVRSTATIQVTTEKTEMAQLDLTDLQGRAVQQLFKGIIVAGSRQNIMVQTGGLPAGVYIIRLVSPEKVITKKVIVAR